MYGTSPEMLQRMYVKGSLRNRDGGFVFQVVNRIESGSLSGIAKLAVDGEERSLEGATIELKDKVHPADEISWSSPLYVSYGSTVTIYIAGALEAGEHTINLQFNVPELGRVSMPIIDAIA
jgi:hypothetical protein